MAQAVVSVKTKLPMHVQVQHHTIHGEVVPPGHIHLWACGTVAENLVLPSPSRLTGLTFVDGEDELVHWR